MVVTGNIFPLAILFFVSSSYWKTVSVWGMELFPLLRWESNGFFYSLHWKTVPVWGMELFPVLRREKNETPSLCLHQNNQWKIQSCCAWDPF